MDKTTIENPYGENMWASASVDKEMNKSLS